MLKDLRLKDKIIMSILLVVTILVTQAAVGFLIGMIGGMLGYNQIDLYTILVASNIVSILAILFILPRYKVKIFKEENVKFLDIIKVIVVTIATNVLIGKMMEYFNINPSNQEALELMMKNKSLIYMILGSAIIVPIAEEMIFRGIIANLFKNRIVGFLISSILFALAHGPKSVYEFIPYFILGLLFTGIYFATGSLKLAILSHMFNNFLATLSLYFK